MLNRAIYVDTPMAVSKRGYSVGNDIWDDFVSYMYKVNPHKKDLSTELLGVQIQFVIGGNIQLKEDDMGLERGLHFVSKEQGIDIDVKDAATGVKTFAYMSQLLRNGWLDKETLLMIDEPEAHLHPQWIVEFARLLVKIHKELGVKVLVASHNPDMVAAIQSIAQKEEVIDKTVFYLAQKEKDETRYVFSDKGTEISDIFTSFNIALSRIEQYGNPVM
jgi:predicted ATPase